MCLEEERTRKLFNSDPLVYSVTSGMYISVCELRQELTDVHDDGARVRLYLHPSIHFVAEVLETFVFKCDKRVTKPASVWSSVVRKDRSALLSSGE